MRNSRIAVVLVLSCLALSCGVTSKERAAAITGVDAGRGASAISRYGCGSCHAIAGITGAHGLVGPPLSGVGDRQYIAGMLPNQPANLIRWVKNPRAINERTVMPNLGVTSQDASDIAAYLYSLK